MRTKSLTALLAIVVVASHRLAEATTNNYRSSVQVFLGLQSRATQRAYGFKGRF